jgi:HSP20 family molecular chaperone IbpA
MGTHSEFGGITKANEKFKISAVSAKDQLTRVQGTVARHAFLEEGCSPGHEVEIWRRAKSELVRPLCHAQMIRDNDIWVETDAGEFEEGTLEIMISPRHVTICGKPRNSRIGEMTKGKGSQSRNEIVFRTLELPVDVEPSTVTAKLNGPILEICFPRVRVKAAGQSG